MYYPTDPIEKLTGVGELLGKKFRNAGIKTAGDLLNYFPFRHEDLSEISTVSQIKEGEKTVLKGEFKNISTFSTRNRKKITKAKFVDETGAIEIIWFNATYIKNQIKENEVYMITGKPTLFGNKLNIANPQIDKSEKTAIHTGRIVPVYFNIPGVFMKNLRKVMLDAVENTEIEDFINKISNPEHVPKNKDKHTNYQLLINNYLKLKDAYHEIHFPTTLENIEKAKDRIALNELIHIKLHAFKQKSIQSELKTNFAIKTSYAEKFINKLPFTLTADQISTCKKIIEQLKNKTPMNSLVSGDVGSGKTIVSIIAANDVIKNGGKVVYLAPTVVLAEQVYKEFIKFFGNTQQKILLVTSSTDKKIVKLLKGSIAKGDTRNITPDIIIGTHALLNIENLSDFANFVIIDEQHKFGVKQRAKLIESKDPPHVLTMTATPIPRSMALAFFNELDVLQINTKPEGRQIITTKVLTESKRKDCYDWIKKEVINDQKIYYIAPFVKISEAENFKDVKSVEELQPQLKKEFGAKNVLVLHGKMKDNEKTEVIEKFKKQKGGVLLSTQVVEVGVDVKEATVIIIESAERFGLASLHQLRGRVGRNNLKSYCFLFPSTTNKADSTRLKFMEKENDGFKLAQLDLENRGGGEIFGIRQSGEIDLKFVDFKNTKLLEDAAKIAEEIYYNKEILESYANNYFTREFFYIKDN